MNLKFNFLFVLMLSTFIANAQVYDITKYGAKGDGKTDNTAAIQKAIDDCSKTGGEVYFPQGTKPTATTPKEQKTTSRHTLFHR